jgi:hypothetical protein
MAKRYICNIVALNQFSFMSRNSKILMLLISMGLLLSCSSDDPVKEDIPEVITKASLSFTPSGGSSAAVVTVTATDPDADGSQSINVDGPINLVKGTKYTLTLNLINELAHPASDGYSISDEVMNEGQEHQFYFAWTGAVFSSPVGDGNIDSPNDVINYIDKDVNNLPVGLTTEWTTVTTAVSGSNTFHIVLKHQPDLKSATSTSNDGETDLDLTFSINVN